MRTKKAALVIAAILAGGGAAWLASSRTTVPYQTATAPLGLLVGWSFIGSGLAACRVRPGNRLGQAMVFTGFAWFASFLSDTHQPVLFTIGTAVQTVYLAGLTYLLLAFPAGRLRTRIDRVVLSAVVALVTVFQLASMLASASRSALCDGCARNLLGVGGDNELAHTIAQVQRLGGVALALVILGLLIYRWTKATAVQRRTIAPMALAGVVTLLAVVATVLNDALGQPLGQTPKRVMFIAAASLPIAMLYVLVQRRLARAAVAGLVVELGEQELTTDLRQALARALGDPSLEVAYWFARAGRYVDAGGQPMELPPPELGRLTTVVERHGQPIAALIHDPALEDNRELIDSVCAAAAMTLENERLQAELRARLSDLQASRARLVDATETERRRIERDLHDGTQQRLVSVAMSLGLLDSKLPSDPTAAKPLAQEARDALAVALKELRELSQGIHPALLSDRGLAAALDDLADRAGLPAYIEVSVDERPCPAVETAAYFVISEALTNAVKHSHATEVRVLVSRRDGMLTASVQDDGIGGAAAHGGSGLRGLADRVEALGGTLVISSPPGRGTRLRAEIPCE